MVAHTDSNGHQYIFIALGVYIITSEENHL